MSSITVRCASCGCPFELTAHGGSVHIVLNENEPDEETLDFCNQACLDAAVIRGCLFNGHRFGAMKVKRDAPRDSPEFRAAVKAEMLRRLRPH